MIENSENSLKDIDDRQTKNITDEKNKNIGFKKLGRYKKMSKFELIENLI